LCVFLRVVQCCKGPVQSRCSTSLRLSGKAKRHHCDNAYLSFRLEDGTHANSASTSYGVASASALYMHDSQMQVLHIYVCNIVSCSFWAQVDLMWTSLVFVTMAFASVFAMSIRFSHAAGDRKAIPLKTGSCRHSRYLLNGASRRLLADRANPGTGEQL
jgi:hypothetical protein